MFRILYLIFAVCILLSQQAYADSERQERQYIHPTNEDLSRLYWAVGAYDLNNARAIDEYIRIHDCDIYEQYFTDDFEWSQIRDSIRQYLKDNQRKFNRYLEFVSSIPLERYSFEKQGFPIQKKYAMDKIGEIVIRDGNFEAYCGLRRPSLEYPENISLFLREAISFDFFPLRRTRAQRLIDSWEEKGFRERLVYMRFRVRVDDFAGIKRGSLSTRAYFAGTLLYIDIFEDPELTKPLFSVQYNDDPIE